MDRAKGRRNVQLVALRVVGSQIRRADLLESRHCRIKRGGATRESELENTCVRRVFRSVWSDPALRPFTRARRAVYRDPLAVEQSSVMVAWCGELVVVVRRSSSAVR